MGQGHSSSSFKTNHFIKRQLEPTEYGTDIDDQIYNFIVEQGQLKYDNPDVRWRKGHQYMMQYLVETSNKPVDFLQIDMHCNGIDDVISWVNNPNSHDILICYRQIPGHANVLILNKKLPRQLFLFEPHGSRNNQGRWDPNLCIKTLCENYNFQLYTPPGGLAQVQSLTEKPRKSSFLQSNTKGFCAAWSVLFVHAVLELKIYNRFFYIARFLNKLNTYLMSAPRSSRYIYNYSQNLIGFLEKTMGFRINDFVQHRYKYYVGHKTQIRGSESDIKSLYDADLKKNRDLLLLPERLRNNFYIVRYAVEKDPRQIYNASDKLKSNPKIFRKAYTRDRDIYTNATEKDKPYLKIARKLCKEEDNAKQMRKLLKRAK